MKFNAYVKQVLATECAYGITTVERINELQEDTLNKLLSVVVIGGQLDNIKKYLFYGRDSISSNVTTYNVQGVFKNPRCLHALIGLVTELPELLDAVAKNYRVNIKEEIGDLMWYLAILVDEYELDFDDILTLNLNKLKARYPNKFTSHDALNRDLDKELEVLENDVARPEHYTSGKIEAIDVIEDKELGFHLGNVVKYVLRAGKKAENSEIKDLKKARWYLDRYIKGLEDV